MDTNSIVGQSTGVRALVTVRSDVNTQASSHCEVGWVRTGRKSARVAWQVAAGWFGNRHGKKKVVGLFEKNVVIKLPEKSLFPKRIA